MRRGDGFVPANNGMAPAGARYRFVVWHEDLPRPELQARLAMATGWEIREHVPGLYHVYTFDYGTMPKLILTFADPPSQYLPIV